MTVDDFLKLVKSADSDKRLKGQKFSSFSDSFRYAEMRSEIIGQLMEQNILDLDDRETACLLTLKEQYAPINSVCGQVQRSLDRKTGLNLTPQKSEFPLERVQTLAHSLTDPTVPDETIQRRARAGTETIILSIHDDYIEENAKFRTKAGIKCYITRTTDGKCCPWCTSIAGRYEYGKEPPDIYRRHDNCTCSVTFENGRERQNVWNKRKWEVKDEYQPKVFSRQQAERIQEQNLNRGLTNGENSGKINVSRNMSAYQQSSPDFSKYTISEDTQAVENIKKTMSENLGISENYINLSGIKNTEVLEPFVNQLQKIQQDTGMRFPAIQAVEVIDNDTCCIASFKPYENKFYISSRYFNSRQALEDTMRAWAINDILPKQAKSIRYLVEHESAHIRIPDEILHTDEAIKIWKKRKLKNKNDSDIYEYFADITAIYRLNPQINDNNILKAVEYLRNKGVVV